MTVDGAPHPLYHPSRACAFCGRGNSSGDLVLVRIRSTLALGYRCADVVSCVRRQLARTLRRRGIAA